MIGVTQMDLDYRRRTLCFLILSLFLHASAVFVLSRDWNGLLRTEAKAKPVDFEVVPLSQKDIEKLKGQIVESSLVQKSEKTTKDAYLSAQTQKVTKQTRAANTAAFRDGKTSSARGRATEHETQKNLKVGDLGVKMNFKPMGNLGPGQLAATSDYLKDVQQGAQTLLNTREYAYFSFYQRVRRQLEQYWEPGLRNRLKSMFERGRQLAADKEHATKLTVVMNAEGSITRVLVDGTSGMLDLDQAAIDAFNKAGPFPNPPKGMVEHDGTVKIEWEFVVKT